MTTPAAFPLRPPFRIGIDVGGTFTDLCLADAEGRLLVRKAPSTPAAPEEGVFAALALAAKALGREVQALLADTALLVHGSTVATNAVLEGKLAPVALLCTAGFRDTLAIRRGMRADPWDHRTPFPPPLVPRHLRLAVRGRLGPDGAEWEALSEADVLAAAETIRSSDVEAVAIGFLHAYADPAHERRAAALLREALGEHPAARHILCSGEVLPIVGEYERIATVAMHAALAPRIGRYLEALEARLAELGYARRLLLVQSNGGACTVAQACARPANLVLSGPAAGVAALAALIGPETGEDFVAIEIGGTSCDVTLMRGGRVELAESLEIAGHPLAVPAVAIHTVGAGGGTIAGVDAAGALFAGPCGAGARPGPAGYGLGGTEPTVTDAQLVLGRLAPGPFAGGALSLDLGLARAAIEARLAKPLGLAVEEAAAGVLRLVTQAIVHAVEEITLRRGLDPRRFVLVAGGGAGPMFGCEAAEGLGIARVLVPRLAGAFCALGMLAADIRLDRSVPFAAALDEGAVAAAAERLAALEQEAVAELVGEGFDAATISVHREACLRYRGQHSSLAVAFGGAEGLRAAFEAEHEARFGHIQPGGAIEFVALSLAASARLPRPAGRGQADAAEPRETRRAVWFSGHGMITTRVLDSPPPRGTTLAGPALLALDTATVVIPPGWVGRTLATGDVLLEAER
ncbi:MAG: hydantoinase/oxoprolinase family protein [Acetobacteraceae bacterium]|nr:hydantoinase/oxoprolinase family protein [Acetobacteraceae bacterium]